MPQTQENLVHFIDELRRESECRETRRKCHDKLVELGAWDLLKAEDEIEEKRPGRNDPPKRDLGTHI